VRVILHQPELVFAEELLALIQELEDNYKVDALVLVF
jgi:hypothetical protein